MRCFACAWRTLQEEIVLGLFGFKKDIVVERMIGAGETERRVTPRFTLTHQQSSALRQGRTESMKRTNGRCRAAIRERRLDGIGGVSKDIGILLSVVQPDGDLMVGEPLNDTFI